MALRTEKGGGGTYVLGPEFAIDSRYGWLCLRAKFSSLNLVP